MVCERPPAAEGGRGSLTHHLALGLGNTPLQPWLHSFAAPRLRNESKRPWKAELVNDPYEGGLNSCLCSLTGVPNSRFIIRPELADTRRKQGLDMFNLAVRDSFFNDTKYGSRDRSGIHGGLCSLEDCSDLREK